MITKLEIKGFKSLVDVSIELGAVNVFIGANGSGKSNLLEAVGVLSAIISGSLEAEPLRYRGVRLGNPSSFQSYISSVNTDSTFVSACDDHVNYSAAFAVDSEHTSRWLINKESISCDEKEVFNRTRDWFSIQRIEDFLRFDLKNEARTKSVAKYASNLYGLYINPDSDRIHPLRFHPNQTLRNTSEMIYSFLSEIEQFAIFTPGTSQLRGSRTDIQRDPVGLGGSGLGQAIDSMLKIEPDKLGPFDLDEVYELIDWADSLNIDETAGIGETTRLRIGDRFMGNGHKSVSLLEASEGALYVLFLLALVGHEDSPKLFAVDNFDQALHPRLARALTRLVSEQIVDDGSRQMLATTHNPLVLDGLDLLDDRIRLFTVDRDSTGASQVRRVLVTAELMAKADEGFSLSQLWTTGRLGGVPKAI